MVFFTTSLRVGKRPPESCPKPAVPCTLAEKSGIFDHEPEGPPHTPCCKLTLDKKLKLEPEASFRDLRF